MAFWGVVLCATVAAGPGCSSTSVPATGNILLDLKHEDPRVRIAAAERAVAENRIDLAAELVENLSDPDGAVRFFTAISLRKLTGQDFGYKAYGTAQECAESIEAWNLWMSTGWCDAPFEEMASRGADQGRGAP